MVWEPSAEEARPVSTEELQSNLQQNHPDFIHKVAQAGVESAPWIGGALGGTIGSILGPAGSVGGTGAGIAGGSVVKDVLEPYVGIQQDKQPIQRVGEAAKDVGTGMATAGAFEGLNFLLGKGLSSALGNKVSKAVEEADKFTPYGKLESKIQEIPIKHFQSTGKMEEAGKTIESILKEIKSTIPGGTEITSSLTGKTERVMPIDELRKAGIPDSQILEWRRAIDRFPRDQNTPVTEKAVRQFVGDIYRNIVHTDVPQTKLPDWVISQQMKFSKALGGVPSYMVKRLGFLIPLSLMRSSGKTKK